jgi:hypothetical protein
MAQAAPMIATLDDAAVASALKGIAEGFRSTARAPIVKTLADVNRDSR